MLILIYLKRKFVSKIISNQQVLDLVQSKWKEVTMMDLTPDILINYVNEQIDLIYESQRFNYKKWKTLNVIISVNPVARGSFEEEVSYLKAFLEERFIVFGKKILEANTSSFEVRHEWVFPHD